MSRDGVRSKVPMVLLLGASLSVVEEPRTEDTEGVRAWSEGVRAWSFCVGARRPAEPSGDWYVVNVLEVVVRGETCSWDFLVGLDIEELGADSTAGCRARDMLWRAPPSPSFSISVTFGIS